MLVDYFLYNGEIELLKLRYNYSKEFVTNFIICEGNYTFTGDKKDYTIDYHLAQCNIPFDKVIVLKADLSDEKVQIIDQDVQRAKSLNSNDLNVIKYFARQRIQRNSITHILDKLDLGISFFLISDVDEFLNYDKFKILQDTLLTYNTQVIKVPLIFLENSASTRLYNNENNPVIYNDNMILCTRSQLENDDPTSLRYNFSKKYLPIKINVNEELDFNYGWLFHNIGSIDYKVKKLNCSLASLATSYDYRISQKTQLEINLPITTTYHLSEYNIDHLPFQINHLPNVKNCLLPNEKQAKVVSYILFKDELELFRLHYKLYEKYVDLFVLVQGETNFDGSYDNYPKYNTIAKFNKFCLENNFDKKKIRFLAQHFPDSLFIPSENKDGNFKSNNTQSFIKKEAFDLLDDNDSTKPYNINNKFSRLNWVREKLIRNSLNTYLEDFLEHTIFLCSDIDEVLNPVYFEKILDSINQNKDKILKIPLVRLEFKINRRLLEEDFTFVKDEKGMFLCSKTILKNSSVTHIRDEFNLENEIYYLQESNEKLTDLGWHFTWIGSDVLNRNKAIIFAYNKFTKHNYPMSLTCLRYLESLLGNTLLHGNLKSLTERYDDQELISYFVNDPLLVKFFLGKKITLEQKIAYFKAKYAYFINNKDNLYRTYQTIYSYLPNQTEVFDYSSNLGIGLKAAFNYWNCQISGVESDAIFLQTNEFVPVYQNYDSNINGYLNTFKNINLDFNSDFIFTIPVRLVEEPYLTIPKLSTLIICIDYAHYITIDQGKTLVKSLCEHSDTILFSSANPTEYELVYKNRQWQSYWIKEFQEYGFKCYEIRNKLLPFDFIPKNFKTNLLVFSKIKLGVEVTNPNLYYDKNNNIVEMV